jgi:hypothetical protein
MQCNGGPSSRQARDGLSFCQENTDLFVDIVFQSILIKMFRVQVIMEWSVHVRRVGNNELPGTKDVPSFLEFVEQIIDSNSWSTMHNLLQTQYAINEGFLAFSSLKRLIIFLRENLVHWCNSIMKQTRMGTRRTPKRKREEQIMVNPNDLAQILSATEANKGIDKRLHQPTQRLWTNSTFFFYAWFIFRNSH